jgi:hypothetical protein
MISLVVRESDMMDMTSFESEDSYDGKIESNVVLIRSKVDWKSTFFVKSIATLVTGSDHTKIKESIKVLNASKTVVFLVEKV